MTLWAATQILMGLKYPKEQVSDLTKEITTINPLVQWDKSWYRYRRGSAFYG